MLNISSSNDGVYSCEATLSGGHVKLLSYEIVAVPSNRNQIDG